MSLPIKYLYLPAVWGKKIKADFYHLADKARSTGANIIVRDEFCEYGYLNDLCHTADCILIPYLFTDLSSGALGYAAVHHTPVIGPASGLIGELISDNSLGECVDKISAETLKKPFVSFRIMQMTVFQNMPKIILPYSL